MKGKSKKVEGAYPKVISPGGIEVKIYKTPLTVKGVRYERFSLCYYLGGKRIRKRFADSSEAVRAAEMALIDLRNGQFAINRLTDEDAYMLTAAQERLGPFGLSLTEAIKELVDARAKLPPGATLLEAVGFYASRHPANTPRKIVASCGRIDNGPKVGGMFRRACAGHHQAFGLVRSRLCLPDFDCHPASSGNI